MDLITVIIPYFKKKKYIAKKLKSVTSQSYKKIEVIFVYDETSLVDLYYIKNLVKKDKRIRIMDICESEIVILCAGSTSPFTIAPARLPAEYVFTRT